MKRIALAVGLLLLGALPSWAQQPVRICMMVGQALQCATVNSSGQLSVTATTSPSTATTTMATGAPIATVFSSILAANTTRKGCLVQNLSQSLAYVYFGATGSASTSNSFTVPVNGTISCTTYNGVSLTDNVAATCATGTCSFIIASQ